MSKAAGLISAARRVDEMTQEEAAKAAGISVTSYRSRESDPLEFRLVELKAIADSMSDTARGLLVMAIDAIFLDERTT